MNDFKLGMGDEMKADRDWRGVRRSQVAVHSHVLSTFSGLLMLSYQRTTCRNFKLKAHIEHETKCSRSIFLASCQSHLKTDAANVMPSQGRGSINETEPSEGMQKGFETETEDRRYLLQLLDNCTMIRSVRLETH